MRTPSHHSLPFGSLQIGFSKAFGIFTSVLLASAMSSSAAIVVSSSATAPTQGIYDQGDLISGPPNPTNGNDYTNHAGAPGQTFITPTAFSFLLNSVSVKGGGSASANCTNWSIRISSVDNDGITLLPLLTSLQNPTAAPADTDWITFNFSGADVLTLAANTVYAFEVYVQDPANGNTAYFNLAEASSAATSGYAFTNTGSSNAFDSSTITSSLGYDRTFNVGLTAVPEPSVTVLFGLSALTFVVLRRRLALHK